MEEKKPRARLSFEETANGFAGLRASPARCPPPRDSVSPSALPTLFLTFLTTYNMPPIPPIKGMLLRSVSRSSCSLLLLRSFRFSALTDVALASNRPSPTSPSASPRVSSLAATSGKLQLSLCSLLERSGEREGRGRCRTSLVG